MFDFERLREPSTWAGLGVVLMVLAGQVPGQWAGYLLAASAVCAALSVVMAEKGVPPEQLTADVMKAVNDRMGSVRRPPVVAALLVMGLVLSACSPADLARFNSGADRAVIAGQLFCGKATAAGPLVVALADMAGAPISVTGRGAGAVQAMCAAIGAMPVSPPVQPAQAPLVSAPIEVASK